MLIDILFFSISLIFLEKSLIGKAGYITFSPLTVFLAAYNLLFIFPSIMVLLPFGDVLYMAQAPADILANYEFFNRAFFYTFFLSFCVLILSKRQWFSKRKLDQVVHPSWFYLLFFLGIVLKYTYLGVGLGFNPLMILERVLFPREFTSIKIGTGLINYLQSSVTLLVYYLALLLYFDRRTKTSLFFLIMSALLFFVGGGKQQVLWLAFVYIMVSNKNKLITSAGLLKNLKYMLVIVFVVVVSFSIMVVRSDSRTLFEKLTKYQKESYHSAKVINDFKWQAEYPMNAVLDSLIAPIPRAIWPEKPYVGMYNRYWREKYEANTVRYHTSTYGFIAEAYMVAGFFGAFLYAFIFSFLVFISYAMLIRAKSIFFTFIPIYLSTLFYFFMRTGFTGFVIINVVFTLCICLLLLRKTYRINL